MKKPLTKDKNNWMNLSQGKVVSPDRSNEIDFSPLIAQIKTEITEHADKEIERINGQKNERLIDEMEKLTDQISYLGSMVHELGMEIYKYRMDD
jgi:hypothetical protein